MEVEVSTLAGNGQAVLHVSGDIDVHTAPQLREHVSRIIDDGHHHVIIDLDQVDFIDSTGLGVLVGARKRALVHDGDVRLVSTRASLSRLLSVTGLANTFPLHDSVEEARFPLRQVAVNQQRVLTTTR